MIDTAKLTAAVETLQLYCEQVRHVMVAKGYPEARVIVDVEAGGNSWHDQYAIKVYDDFAGRTAHEMFGIREFEKALAYAESRPPRATAALIAATLGITPDGRVLDRLCDSCGEQPATETWGDGAPLPVPEVHVCETCADKARDRAVERAMEG